MTLSRILNKILAGKIVRPAYAKEIKILCKEKVFPIFMRSTHLLITILKLMTLTGKKILDLGTGSGILAIFCAKHSSSKVYASDICNEAIKAAKINAKLNNVELNIRQGNLFSPFEDERFDIILFNPPFFPLTPSTVQEKTLFSGKQHQVIQEFIKKLPSSLQEGGYAVVCFSSLSLPPLERYLPRGLQKEKIAQIRGIPGEKIIAYRLSSSC